MWCVCVCLPVFLALGSNKICQFWDTVIFKLAKDYKPAHDGVLPHFSRLIQYVDCAALLMRSVTREQPSVNSCAMQKVRGHSTSCSGDETTSLGAQKWLGSICEVVEISPFRGYPWTSSFVHSLAVIGPRGGIFTDNWQPDCGEMFLTPSGHVT